MIYITGDTHGDFRRYNPFMAKTPMTKDDVMIVLGDAGLNYYGDERDTDRKEYVNGFPFTTFCIHGNHEMRPVHVPDYELQDWQGGKVWVEPQYPNLLFAKDGEVFDLDGKSCLVIGGAYSIDKFWRQEHGYRWFEDEQPSKEIRSFVESQLDGRNWQVDIVLSHTCPLKYEPTENFIAGYDQSTVDQSTERWLDEIEQKLTYGKWYCGHFHTEKKIDKIEFMAENIGAL